MVHHPHLKLFCILYIFPKLSLFFFKQNVLTMYTYQQVFHKISSWLSKFWFHGKCSKVNVLQTLLKMLSPPNDTHIFGKFLHNNKTESSEIQRDGSYWLTESYCTVFMRKTCCIGLKIEFNDFTVSLRGGWLYYIIRHKSICGHSDIITIDIFDMISLPVPFIQVLDSPCITVDCICTIRTCCKSSLMDFSPL